MRHVQENEINGKDFLKSLIGVREMSSKTYGKQGKTGKVI
jgi:hypothetical protein